MIEKFFDIDKEDVYEHKNVENVIRYFLLFLPPRGVGSIIDIGAGVTTPYRGVLSTRCKEYVALDIRPSYQGRVDYVCDITEGTEFQDNRWDWGWCSETLEHIPQDKQKAFVDETLRICKNVVFTYPSPAHPVFYDDPGHNEVLINMHDYEDRFNVVDKTTKSGRCIFILSDKERIVEVTKRGIFHVDG